MVIHKYNHLSSNRACERLITLCVKIQHIHSSHSFVSFNEHFHCTLLLPNEWMNEWISTEKKWDLLQFLHREGDFCKYSMRSFVMKGSQLYIYMQKNNSSGLRKKTSVYLVPNAAQAINFWTSVIFFACFLSITTAVSDSYNGAHRILIALHKHQKCLFIFQLHDMVRIWYGDEYAFRKKNQYYFA